MSNVNEARQVLLNKMSRDLEKRNKKGDKITEFDFLAAKQMLGSIRTKDPNIHFETLQQYIERLDQMKVEMKVSELLNDASKTINEKELKKLFNQIKELDPKMNNRGKFDAEAEKRAKKRLRVFMNSKNGTKESMKKKQFKTGIRVLLKEIEKSETPLQKKT